MYELADLAFVGGSLGPFGGHNILEPAQHGVPIMVGPHTENFREIVEIFLRADALKAVDDESFAREMLALLRDYPKREALGRRAAEVFRAQAGATARTLAALEELLGVAPVVEAVSAQPADLSRERG
jgi:3-deoxy-D-manno-octulosonic-acid transferase